MGFEPALQRTLAGLLAREPDLVVADPSDPKVDTLVLFPPNADWVQQLRARYPGARFLAVVDWERRPDFAGTPIQGYVDRLLGYEGLLELVRADSIADSEGNVGLV